MTKIESCIAEDALIQGISEARGKRVEVFAFGMTYIGNLVSVDIENGFITIKDGDDKVMLELERIEHFDVVEG